MLSYGVNLFLFSSGRLATGQQPVLGTAVSYSDPLPQALVLTAIVIGFAMTAFVVVLSLRNLADNEDDHVDGKQPYKSPAPEQEEEVNGK